MERILVQTGDWIEETWILLLFVLSLAGGIRLLEYSSNPKLPWVNIPWESILQGGELGLLVLLLCGSALARSRRL